VAAAAALTAGAPVLAAPAPAPTAKPDAFMKRVVAQVLTNDYAAAWRTLHPGHKRVAPQGEYVSCELQNPILQSLEQLRVVSVASRRLRVPGERRAVTVKAVRIRITLYDGETGSSFDTTHVFHAVAVKRRWTWILPATAYEVYRTDSCLG
jgi:hypothetical protein